MIFTNFLQNFPNKKINKNSHKGHNKYRLCNLYIYIPKMKEGAKMEKNKELKKQNKQNKQNNEQNNQKNNDNNK